MQSVFFSRPAFKYIESNSSKKGFFAILARYFSYVWIDATATSGVASALYIGRLDRTGLKHSRFNAIYPLLVTLLGTLLKVILAVASIPVVLSIKPFSLVVNSLGLDKRYPAIDDIKSKLDNIYRPLLGIITGTVMSNINPVFLLKTLFFDTYICYKSIIKINNKVRTSEPNNVDNVIDDKLNIQQHPTNQQIKINKVVAYVSSKESKASSGNLIKEVINSFINGYKDADYEIKLSHSEVNSSLVINRREKFDIYNKDGKLLGVVQTNFNNGNEIGLSFTQDILQNKREAILENIFARIINSVIMKQPEFSAIINISDCSDISKGCIDRLKSLNKLIAVEEYSDSRSVTPSPPPVGKDDDNNKKDGTLNLT